ncbi:ATP-binding protein [Amycolatopsis sp. NPDC004625]|uniref:ATP-binding protein n=1 Tax=Amycolatopsis sp. NPDC004625 TaxID=3154670 RepID=UPI0033BA9EFB
MVSITSIWVSSITDTALRSPPDPVASRPWMAISTPSSSVRGQGVVQRRALSVGVGSFDHHHPLDYAPDLSEQLGQELAELGYVTSARQARARVDGDDLGAMVTRALADGDDDDLSIVHIVSHGESVAGEATVFAIGSDGARHSEASITHWLTMRQSVPGPTTLFLLDLCAAGTAARLPWQTRLTDAPRGWVIAACGPQELAFGGRFTQAVINVLRGLRSGELDIDPGTEYVPLTTIARAIRQEVNRLAVSAGAIPQQVTASLVDLSSDYEPRFFRNPEYEPSPRRSFRAEVDPGVVPFFDDLDEGLDARHFVERATGLGGMRETGATIACFSGRDEELRRISLWLTDHRDGQALYVVTGSPGAGKSALLGVLTCAASSQLRAVTQHIWSRVAQAPVTIDGLAAVHARQRGLDGVAGSIARQLGVPESLPVGELVDVLRDRSAVLVIDALDEADDPVRIMNELLLPLVQPGNPVRLLVGVRDYEDFRPLFEQATMIDLDRVERHVLENDLFNYVINLLRATPHYRASGGVSGEFASAVSATLAQPGQTGPFLVAGLYTRQFVTGEAVHDAAEAARLGHQVPRDPAGVLDLDLALHQDEPWLRPVLTALAHARGAGMPISLLRRVAPAFAESPVQPSVAQVRVALRLASFYLRQSLDTDHSNLYRLFHQGLADALVAEGSFTVTAFEAMLSSLGPADRRDWNAAEPYLLRHVADHAADLGLADELIADPGLVLHPEFAGEHGFGAVTSAAELALAATRRGMPALAARAAEIAGLGWWPCWSMGSETTPGRRVRKGAATLSYPGKRVTLVGQDGLREWEWPANQKPVYLGTEPLAGHLVTTVAADGSFAMARDNEVVVVGGGPLNMVAPFTSDVLALARANPSGYLCVTADGMVRAIAEDGTATNLQDTRHHSTSWALGARRGDPTAVAVDPEGQLVFFEHGQVWKNLYPVPGRVSCFGVSADGDLVAAGAADGWVGLVDRRRFATWNYEHKFDQRVTAVAVGLLSYVLLSYVLAVGLENGRVVVISADTRQELVVAKPAAAEIVDISVSAEGRCVALDANGILHYIAAERTGTLEIPHTPAPQPMTDQRSPLLAVAGNGRDGIFVATEDQVLHIDPRTGAMVAGIPVGAVTTELVLTELEQEQVLLVRTGGGDFLWRQNSGLSRVLAREWVLDQLRHQTAPCEAQLGDRIVTVVRKGNRVVVSEPGWEDTVVGFHQGLSAVHCARLAGRAVVFSGGSDGVVRIWDVERAALLDSVPVGRSVQRIFTTRGADPLLVAAGGELIAFRNAVVAATDG